MEEKNKLQKLWIREEKETLEANKPKIPKCPYCNKLMQVFITDKNEYFYTCDCSNNKKTMLSEN